MAKADMSIGLDSDAKRHIQRLVAAIDALVKAINDGEKVDKDSISEPVVQRLVEDAQRRQTSDGQALPDDPSYYRDADGRLQYHSFKGDWSTRD